MFELTTAKELFTSDPLRNRTVKDSEGSSSDIGGEDVEHTESKNSIIDDAEEIKEIKDKSSIVVKSVLQLLLIQSLSELFESDDFYENVPYDYLFKMAKLLFKSYNFAKV